MKEEKTSATSIERKEKMKCVIKAPAKINLFLEIGGKRADGYHNIFSLMHTIPLCDTVSAERLYPENGERKIFFTCSDPSLPIDNQNLAYKAAEHFFERFSDSPYAMRLHIDKVIPKEAGLGGGSADAAAVLMCCARLYPEQIRTGSDKLYQTAVSLGADVPFCLMRGAAAAYGIGEILKPTSVLPDCFIVIAKGPQAVSTAAAYRTLDDIPKSAIRSDDLSEMIACLKNQNLDGICTYLYNRFEEAVFPDCPTALSTKLLMLEYGAKGALMSGSGSAVFGLFESACIAESAVEALRKMSGISVWTLFSGDIKYC